MKTVPAGAIKRIHINGALLRQHATGRKAVKPIAVQRRGGKGCARWLGIFDEEGRIVAELMFRPELPLKSGAVLWIETRAAVKYA